MALGSDDSVPLQHTPDPAPRAEPLAALKEDEARKRRMRSLALAWALFALVVMFFLVTIVRLGANVANRPF